jgi:hypothetical protein
MAVEMTAIVAGSGSGGSARQTCRQILTGSEIAIQPLSGLDGFLQGVRQELNC